MANEAGRSTTPAWKQAQEEIAKRNEEASKAGKKQREGYEKERESARQAAERRRMSDLIGKDRKR